MLFQPLVATALVALGVAAGWFFQIEARWIGCALVLSLVGLFDR